MGAFTRQRQTDRKRDAFCPITKHALKWRFPGSMIRANVSHYRASWTRLLFVSTTAQADVLLSSSGSVISKHLM
jgi:hypothetical protein